LIKHIHFTVVDCVLLAAGGNYTANIVSCATFREICTFYNDTRYIQFIAPTICRC
ncbi:hypothetical protein DOY81_011640, partial [Sarcophaga bullata]